MLKHLERKKTHPPVFPTCISKGAVCLELPMKSVHLLFSFKLIQLEGEDVLGVNRSQKNKILHTNCFCCVC